MISLIYCYRRLPITYKLYMVCDSITTTKHKLKDKIINLLPRTMILSWTISRSLHHFRYISTLKRLRLVYKYRIEDDVYLMYLNRTLESTWHQKYVGYERFYSVWWRVTILCEKLLITSGCYQLSVCMWGDRSVSDFSVKYLYEVSYKLLVHFLTRFSSYVKEN